MYLTIQHGKASEALKTHASAEKDPKATVGIVHATVHAREGWWDKKSVVDVISFEMKMKHGGNPTHI